MKCNLCLEEKVKLCKAHLIPESFYRFMYTDGKVEGNSLLMISDNKNYLSRKRIGIYDSTILCEECDKWLGKKYDEYGKIILLDSEPEILATVEKKQLFVFNNINSSILKLFFLSVLWRHTISNLPELKNCFLPSNFNDQLREMLLSENPGEIDDFSVLLTRYSYRDENKSLHKYTQFPVKSRMEGGVNYHNLYFPNGYKVFIKTDKRPQPEVLKPFSINTASLAYVLNFEEFESTKEFIKIIGNLHKFNKNIIH